MKTSFLLIPLIFFALGLTAQTDAIQVSQEPRHHKVLENAWVRVLDVRIPPGDTSLMHKHSTPSVFMVLSNTQTGSQAIVEPEKPDLSDGHVWFEGFYTTPRIHRVWNSGSIVFHVIDMEILHSNPGELESPLVADGLSIQFDEKPVRAYRMELSANTRMQFPKRKKPVLVVGLVKGDFTYFPPGKPVRLANVTNNPHPIAIYEFK
jgi:hypothetical protein